jgi:urease accessory protein
MKPVEALQAEGWRAVLELGYAADDERTWLAHRRHSGPLMVQRPFFPEDAKVCQTVIVHPPGGIAGGDELVLNISAGPLAYAQLTTPGAGKWYRGFGRDAHQTVRIDVADGALCEWLPQENIIFDGAHAHMSLNVELSRHGAFCGWDFTCLGRPHSGESFGSGAVRQFTAIRQEGKAVFREQACIKPADIARPAPALLAGHCAYGSMVVVGAEAGDDVVAAARNAVAGDAHAGVTRIGPVLIARWVGNNVEAGRDLFTRLWAVLRPWYAGREAVVPRIWAT